MHRMVTSVFATIPLSSPSLSMPLTSGRRFAASVSATLSEVLIVLESDRLPWRLHLVSPLPHPEYTLTCSAAFGGLWG
jgi:hypothetical protein